MERKYNEPIDPEVFWFQLDINNKGMHYNKGCVSLEDIYQVFKKRLGKERQESKCRSCEHRKRNARKDKPSKVDD